LKINPITVILIAVFFYPIIKGFIFEFSSHNLKKDIYGVESDIDFVVSLILGFYFTRKIFVQHEENIYVILYDYLSIYIESYMEQKPVIIYILAITIIFFIMFYLVKAIFYMLNFILLYPILDGIENSLRNRTKFFKKIIGALFEFPRAICYILFITFLINVLAMLNVSPPIERYLEVSKVYNYLCTNIVIPITNSSLAKRLPSIINNSLKIEIVQNDSRDLENGSNSGKSSKSNTSERTSNQRTIVYYNGVTIEEGIQSNQKIDDFAEKIASNIDDDKIKAKNIYTWIGKNIDYDYSKANRVLNNDFNIESGAVAAFKERKGICFDYACLYVAMCRAVGIKVRLVTGEGFNGVSWVSHAWNQVYISSEENWINVDTTFYKGGNYFDSKRFNLDHKDSKVIGEW
jgi:transglutaminase-like putative cysteine protease